MLNKSHSLSRYKENSGKNKKKCLMDFDPDDRVLAIDTRYDFMKNFIQ